MASLAAFASSDSDMWQDEFLVVNLAALLLLSVFNAIFQGSVTASLGPFPEKYMGSFMSGQGRHSYKEACFGCRLITALNHIQSSN